jgi:hypothetical protein
LGTDLSDAHGDGGALLAGEVVLALGNVRAHVVEHAHLSLNSMQGVGIFIFSDFSLSSKNLKNLQNNPPSPVKKVYAKNIYFPTKKVVCNINFMLI